MFWGERLYYYKSNTPIEFNIIIKNTNVMPTILMINHTIFCSLECHKKILKMLNDQSDNLRFSKLKDLVTTMNSK